MRIWSLHPRYLDVKGLLALWREALLAKHVLEGATKGYKNHPQLNRFKAANDPLQCMNQYLLEVYKEAKARGYHFDETKIDPGFIPVKLTVTRGQMDYEQKHLSAKLKSRDPGRYQLFRKEKIIETHPLFLIIDGAVEDWERTVR